MSNFNVGNVVRLSHGSVVIITEVRSNYTNWIPIDSDKVSGGCKNISYIEESQCWTCDINDGGYQDEDCVDCHGTGYYNREISGMDKATFMAHNVKSYIMKAITKNFEF